MQDWTASAQEFLVLHGRGGGTLEELVPSAWHHGERYADNPVEADHGQLKHRLRPTRGLRTDRIAQVVIAGHAFVQNLRRGHYDSRSAAGALEGDVTPNDQRAGCSGADRLHAYLARHTTNNSIFA